VRREEEEEEEDAVADDRERGERNVFEPVYDLGNDMNATA